MAVRSAHKPGSLPHRAQFLFAMIVLSYLGLIARLFFLQGAMGGSLRDEAIRRRQQKIPLHAHTGTILDCNGRSLAVSLYAGKVGFDPLRAVAPTDPKAAAQLQTELQASILQAAPILGMAPGELARRIDTARRDFNPLHPQRFVVLKEGVSLETASQIRDARPRLLGFGIEDGSQRVYTSAASAAQVVGFVNRDGVGQAGLERGCRKWLTGRDGFAIAELDDHHREIPGTIERMVEARHGLDVHTTLDANVQHIVTEEAQKIVQQFHPKGVSVVAVEPNSGDILALASLPDFDPNPGQRGTITHENLAERCVTRLYEPGSTLKALTIAAALDDHAIRLDSGYYCPGYIKIGKKIIHCAHGERHDQETPRDIMRHSCNVGAALIGLHLGGEKLYAADRKFGLLDRPGTGLPGEAHGRLSFDRNEQIFSAAKIARVAFGHSITTTPLHVAMAYAALANGGNLMKPRLLTSLTDANGKTTQQWQPQVVRRVIAPETAAHVQEMLRAVVADGTAKTVALPGYQIAGKTGTAQKYRPGAYVSSFVGYLPASPNVKPRVVLLVAVDEPQGKKYYGAEVAGPAFRAMASRLMTYWRVPEDDPQSIQQHLALENLKKAATAVAQHSAHSTQEASLADD